MINCYDGGCERCGGNAKSGEALDECFCVHAEENAILEIGNLNTTELFLEIKNRRVLNEPFEAFMG